MDEGASHGDPEIRAQEGGHRHRCGAQVTLEGTGVGHIDGAQAEVLGGVEDESVNATPATVDRGGVDPGARGDLGDGDRLDPTLFKQLDDGVQQCSTHACGTAAGTGAHHVLDAHLRRLTSATRLHVASLEQRVASTADRTLQS